MLFPAPLDPGIPVWHNRGVAYPATQTEEERMATFSVEYQMSDGRWVKVAQAFADQVGAERFARSVCVFWRVVDGAHHVRVQGPSR